MSAKDTADAYITERILLYQENYNFSDSEEGWRIEFYLIAESRLVMSTKHVKEYKVLHSITELATLRIQRRLYSSCQM